MATERLDRLLSRLGYCSRSQLKSALGRVLVGGERPRRSDVKVEANQVLWDGHPLDPDPLWILLHKPADLTCSHRDAGPLLYSLFPDRYMQRRPALSSVGRLDRDTTGVLLLTTDGPGLHRLTSPRHQVEKVYQVELRQPPLPEDLELMKQGGWQLENDPKPLLPCKVVQTSETEVEMTLTEGRTHQIKRMWEARENLVTRLHRSRFANLTCGGLNPGEFRLLGLPELEALLS